MNRIVVPIQILILIVAASTPVYAAPCSYFDEAGNIHYTNVYSREQWFSLGCGGTVGEDPVAARNYRERCCKNAKKGGCKLRKECKPKPVKGKKGKSKKKQKKKKG